MAQLTRHVRGVEKYQHTGHLASMYVREKERGPELANGLMEALLVLQLYL